MKRSLVLLACVAVLDFSGGCGQTPAPSSVPQASPDVADHGHDHGAGPHGGTLTDWGGGTYHVEFTVDHDTKESVVFILGSDEKTAEPIKASSIHLVIADPPTEVELLAKPLEGEPEGSSSRFAGTHDTLGIVREFAGTIYGEIDGTPYTGDFQEEPHGAEHKH